MRVFVPTVNAALAGCLAAILLGCVNENTWTPTVDTYGDPNAARLSEDEAQCRKLAEQASGGSLRKTAEGVGIGGAIGAAAGAALGAIAGAPGEGAALGATLGGFTGGTKEGFQSNQDFETAFKQCLRERGHKVLGRTPTSRVRPVRPS